MKVSTSPAVRIIPPSDVTGDRWLADHIISRRRYVVRQPVAALLVAAWSPQSPRALAESMSTLGSSRWSIDQWDKVIAELQTRELLIDSSEAERDPELAWLTELRRSWARYGWHEAAEYHALAFNYPCVDYTEALGWLFDRERMKRYGFDEADTNRRKLDYLAAPEHSLPTPDAGLGTESAHRLWTGEIEPRQVTAERLSVALSLTFGVTGEDRQSTRSAALLRRSSPSGGSRHPAEGYVLVMDVDGLEPGVCHVTMQPFGLRRFAELPSARAVDEAFVETVGRHQGRARVLLVITSMFERNMYRYREPRTFRTVHMDAGHLASTMTMVCRSQGLAASVYCDDGPKVEELLDIDGMQEGYMVTVAISDGIDDRALVRPTSRG